MSSVPKTERLDRMTSSTASGRSRSCERSCPKRCAMAKDATPAAHPSEQPAEFPHGLGGLFAGQKPRVIMQSGLITGLRALPLVL